MTAVAETTQANPLNETKLNELLGRFVTDFGAAVQAPLIVIGHELGLYRALGEGAATTSDLAERTGTAERYVREWARSLAAGGYVTYDASSDRYSLSPEQALVFDQDGPAFIVGGFEVALAAAKALPRALGAFRDGGGVAWHEHDARLFSGTAAFFAGGYRMNLVANWIPALDGMLEKLEAGARVADIGCGHGISTLLMAQAFPASTFFGFDYHEESLEVARTDARNAGAGERVRFVRATATDYPGRAYELITMFDCLHDLGDPLAALVHARQAIADDGVVMIVEPRAGNSVEENLHPVGRAFYSASTLFCTPNSLSQDGRHGLGAQAGEAAVRELAGAAGFSRFRTAAQTPFNLIFELRP